MIRFTYFMCSLVLFCATASAAPTPRETVERLHDHLIAVMQQSKQLGVQGRFDYLNSHLRDLYDFERMTQFMLGSQWRDAPADQRRTAVDTFASFSAASYASQFSGYSGERFEIVGEKPGPRETLLVATRLIRGEGNPIDLTYLLAETAGDWRIIDVFYQGTISETARLRSEFRDTLSEGGPPQLIEKLQEKTRELLDEPA